MFKNLRRYGIYKPYVLTVSIIVAIIMFILHDTIFVWVGSFFVFLAIMTILRNFYRYHLIRAFINDQDLTNCHHALDLATKKGYSLIQLAQHANSAFIDGFEEDTDNYTKEAIKNAKHNRKMSRIKIRHGDVRYLPYPSDYFDVITIMPPASSRYVSRHELDHQAAFQAAIRVLAPKGIALIVMPKRPAIRAARYLYARDNTIDIYMAKPAYQLLFGYQPILIQKKVASSDNHKQNI